VKSDGSHATSEPRVATTALDSKILDLRTKRHTHYTNKEWTASKEWRALWESYPQGLHSAR